MSNLESMLNSLKQAGYRLTPQRKAICRLLTESEDHPSAQMLFDQLRKEYDTLSLATVYNTLEALSDLGAVTVLGEIGSSDSVRYDANTLPHVNLACVHCHRIIDIHSSYVQRLDQEIENNSGFSLLGARMVYYGICPDCQAAKADREHQNAEGNSE